MSELTGNRIRTTAEKLGLPHLAETINEFTRRADEAKSGYLDFLDLARSEELAVHDDRRFRQGLRLSPGCRTTRHPTSTNSRSSPARPVQGRGPRHPLVRRGQGGRGSPGSAGDGQDAHRRRSPGPGLPGRLRHRVRRASRPPPLEDRTVGPLALRPPLPHCPVRTQGQPLPGLPRASDKTCSLLAFRPRSTGLRPVSDPPFSARTDAASKVTHVQSGPAREPSPSRTVRCSRLRSPVFRPRREPAVRGHRRDTEGLRELPPRASTGQHVPR